MNVQIDYYLDVYKNDHMFYPYNRKMMIDHLKMLIDNFTRLCNDLDSKRVPRVIEAIKWLKKTEPKIFYQARPYLHDKRNKHLSAILRTRNK